MENYFYIAIVAVLALLAISDLIVGVSNDAVNFLNSAIGSKVAKYWVIMLIAAIGIMVGATFSNGMMEVARKSIFHPGMFYFNEIMIIFMAVMITDVILLDTFNTYGLPTSTTVSIVFELLGAAVAMAVVKANAGSGVVGDYINTKTAMTIIFGILLSVVVAFTVGMVVQALSRLMFTFNFEKTYKYFGALFGGFAITAITFFMLIKGAKGTTFIHKDTIDWINANKTTILIYSFFGWAIVLQLLMWIFNVNILKLIVLIGTFSLAMAFAGNDLVNFVGVPLAGFESFKQFNGSGQLANEFLMDGLMKKIPTPIYFLLLAGLVMVLTLWFSKKAKSVTKTSLDLSRQDEGDERFGSSLFARVLVREGIRFGSAMGFMVPKPIANYISTRFDQRKTQKKKKKDKASFDLVRASVNLIVAAILIAIGTANKLPLSTTYVTFMVAMGTSLADGAWNRESAVYRITGVFTVIGGWFFTAFAAFSTAFIITLIINWQQFTILIFIALAIFLAIRTHLIHKKSYDISEKEEKEEDLKVKDSKSILKKCNHEVSEFYKYSSKNIFEAIKALIKNKRKPLLKIKTDLKDSDNHIAKLKRKGHRNLVDMPENELEYGYFYLNVLDQLELAFQNQIEIVKQIFEHIDNNHKPLEPSDNKNLEEFIELMLVYENNLMTLVNKPEKESNKIREQRDELINMVIKHQKSNIKQIKKENFSTKSSLLFQGIMTELSQYVKNTFNLMEDYKSYFNKLK